MHIHEQLNALNADLSNNMHQDTHKQACPQDLKNEIPCIFTEFVLCIQNFPRRCCTYFVSTVEPLNKVHPWNEAKVAITEGGNW